MAGLLNRAERVKLALRLYVRLMRFISRLEIAEPFLFSASRDDGVPALSAAFPHGPGQSGNTIRSGLAVVLHVLSMTRRAKIADAVVVPIAVDVVDAVFWPSPVKVDPSQSVGVVHAAAPIDLDSSGSHLGASDMPGFDLFACRPAPSKNASLGVVVKSVADFFRRNVSFTHMAPIINWSSIKRTWPGADDSPVRPLKLGQVGMHFNMGAASWAF